MPIIPLPSTRYEPRSGAIVKTKFPYMVEVCARKDRTERRVPSQDWDKHFTWLLQRYPEEHPTFNCFKLPSTSHVPRHSFDDQRPWVALIEWGSDGSRGAWFFKDPDLAFEFKLRWG